MLEGGTLAYGLQDDDDSLGDLSDLVNKRRKVGPNGEVSEEVLFYRAPPVQLSGNKIVTNSNIELGHSASYLAWKLNQKK